MLHFRDALLKEDYFSVDGIRIHKNIASEMSKTVTLRLSEQNYKWFRTLAERDNRPLFNFIETAASRYVESEQFVDEFEMEEIRHNAELSRSLRRGIMDAKAGRGRFV